MMTTPTYTMVIPSTETPVKYRPFLVREEKALLIAQQSEDVVVMVNTLKDVINSCVIDNIDVNKLATFDIEYMFTQIRAKSVGEVIELIFPCDVDHGVDNEKARVKVPIDLTSLVVVKNPEHSSRIDLFGDVGVVMKYPTIEIMKKLEKLESNSLEAVFDIIAASIDYIYQGDEIYYGKEQTQDELSQFFNNLTSEQFLKVQQFFETMPRIRKEIDYTCPLCGKEHHKVLEGMQSFF